MNATTGVAGVLTRINDIGSRFGAPSTPQTVVVQGEAFDPFGSAYAAAMATVDQSPAPTAAAFAQSYAPVVPTTGTLGSGATPLASTASNTSTTSPTSITSIASGGVAAPSPPTSEQIQLAIDGTVGVAGQRQVGGYGRIAVPPELAGFGNGRIPGDQLAPIGQGSHRLWAPAAASWQNLVAAAQADGISLKITDSYRSYDEQVDLAARKGLYQNGGLAAVPGTSNHGWGMAVDADVRDPQTMEWLRVNGPRFGWVEAVTREPWHWEFRPSQV